MPSSRARAVLVSATTVGGRLGNAGRFQAGMFTMIFSGRSNSNGIIVAAKNGSNLATGLTGSVGAIALSVFDLKQVSDWYNGAYQ